MYLICKSTIKYNLGHIFSLIIKQRSQVSFVSFFLSNNKAGVDKRNIFFNRVQLAACYFWVIIEFTSTLRSRVAWGFVK